MTGQKRRGLESRSEFAARLQRMQEFDAQPFTGYGDSSLAQQAIEALADHDVVITTYKAFSTFYKHFVKVHWKRHGTWYSWPGILPGGKVFLMTLLN